MNIKLICLPTSTLPNYVAKHFVVKSVNRACLKAVKTEVVMNMLNYSHCLRVTVGSLSQESRTIFLEDLTTD